MAEAQTTAPAPQPPQDGGADPTAHELPGGNPAGNPDPSADPAADPPADPGANPPADPIAEPGAEPAAKDRMRFEEVTKKARQWEQQAKETDRRLQQALTALERAAPTATPAPPPAPQDERPQAPQFETPEQYQQDMAQYAQDLAAWTTRTQLKALRAQEQRDRAEGEQLAQQQRVLDSLAAGRVAAMAEIADFAEVAESPDVSISVPMANAIALLEHQSKGNGTKVWYFLGKNPSEAARIAALPPADQLLEMGMLVPKAISALAPKAPTRTNAPAPIKPLGGGSTPASKSVDEMSMEEYAAHRNKR